jgi:ComF family protein
VVLDAVAGAMVHALKYRGWGELAKDMARRMAGEIPPSLSDPVLVPVPTTPWRRRTRGYNQASLLATALSSIAEVPSAEVLRRERGRTQVRLGPRERRWNVHGAFDLRGETRSLIRGRDVIVVDDVLTTGATANAVTLALEPAGVASVRLITFARSLPFAEKGRR